VSEEKCPTVHSSTLSSIIAMPMDTRPRWRNSKNVLFKTGHECNGYRNRKIHQASYTSIDDIHLISVVVMQDPILHANNASIIVVRT
jgi:hypothetical protein